MNKNVVVITSKSSVGKDTVLNILIKDYEYKSLISHTTRPMRPNEIQNETYHFIDDSTFKDMICRGEFIEYRKYNTIQDGKDTVWYYGLAKQSLSEDENYVVILDLQGAKDFVNHYGYDKCLVVYLECDRDVRLQRAMNRAGAELAELERRMEADDVDFSEDKVKDIAQYIVNNTFSTPQVIAQDIHNVLKLFNNW